MFIHIDTTCHETTRHQAARLHSAKLEAAQAERARDAEESRRAERLQEQLAQQLAQRDLRDQLNVSQLSDVLAEAQELRNGLFDDRGMSAEDCIKPI